MILKSQLWTKVRLSDLATQHPFVVYTNFAASIDLIYIINFFQFKLLINFYSTKQPHFHIFEVRVYSLKKPPLQVPPLNRLLQNPDPGHNPKIKIVRFYDPGCPWPAFFIPGHSPRYRAFRDLFYFAVLSGNAAWRRLFKNKSKKAREERVHATTSRQAPPHCIKIFFFL